MESAVTFLSTLSPCEYLPDRIWQLRYELVPHLRVVRKYSVPSSGHVVTASDDETAVWQLGETAPVATAPFGVDGRALAVSTDGRYAATVYRWDLRLWSLPNLNSIAGT
jgi:hypothetical protein